MKIFCIDINNHNFNKINKLNYIPVGLGSDEFKKGWLRDNTGDHISDKNPFYGEYSFHYWLWKNKLHEFEDEEWLGFCAYRRFWSNKIDKYTIKNLEDFLSETPKEWKGYNTILGQNIFLNWKFSKIIRHGLRSLITNPKLILKKNWNIKYHFDSFHGYGNLDSAIDLLEEKDREDFREFTRNRNFYNRSSMFFCNSKKIMNDYYSTVFPWMERCEKIFGFEGKDYGLKRIYGFLIERFQSFWFQKYTNPLIWPIVFHDITKSNLFKNEM
jgi:hypothetical protein